MKVNTEEEMNLGNNIEKLEFGFVLMEKQ